MRHLRMDNEIVESVRSEIGAIRPDDRAEIWIDTYLTKLLNVLQGLEETSVQFTRKIDLTLRPVAECKFEDVPGNVSYGGYVWHVRITAKLLYAIPFEMPRYAAPMGLAIILTS